jgi:hypothetical protein
MQKNVSYHESAIQYNEELALEAEKQEQLVEHPEVKKWCRSVARQHRFHEKRHRASLAKMLRVQAAAEAGELTESEILADQQARENRDNTPVEQQADWIKKSTDDVDGPNHDDPQVEAEAPDVDHRSSVSGQYVTEEFAEENPATTVSETGPVEIPATKKEG